MRSAQALLSHVSRCPDPSLITCALASLQIHWSSAGKEVTCRAPCVQVSRSLAACEGCLLVVDAAQGVEAQTLANVYLAMENELEIIVVLNKVDLPGVPPYSAWSRAGQALCW